MAMVRGARRFSLHLNRAVDNSDSGYGEGILPTIDPKILARLWPQQYEAFTEMGLKDRMDMISRWRKDGFVSAQTDGLPPNESAVHLLRSSSAPQLPELQMDVPTAIFTDADGDSSSLDAAPPAGLGAQETMEEVDASAAGSIHHHLRFTPSQVSMQSGSSQPEPYADETPEKRCLRKLHRDQMALDNLQNERDREWARFRGIGKPPPGNGLFRNSPTAEDKIHARIVTKNNAVVQATGRRPDAEETLDIVRGIDDEERALYKSKGTPDLYGPMFVRSGASIIAPAMSFLPATHEKQHTQRKGLGRPTDAAGFTQGSMYGRDDDCGSVLPNNLPERFDSVCISPMKRMSKKIEATKQWIRKACKSKTERKKKARTTGRPLSRANLYDEAQAPVVVMNTQSGDRQTGRKAQLSNITAAKTVADIIRSCLGPNAMLKMLLDPMGGIALTNDGHAILREIEVAHPAAKNMIELSRTQDEEVGDGTTTVIILAGEILAQALPQLERNIHPVVIISAFKRALNDALSIVEKVSMPVNTNDDQAMYRLISSAIDTKYAARWSQMMCSIALKAVRTVSHDAGGGKKEVDIKRYAKVEKVPGGQIEDSRVLDGVMLNKDITHPKMRRKIENPRVILLDCPLEYKKGESQTNIEISKEEDWNRILQIEEEQVKIMTDAIIALKPDVVITEKGVSDLAQHFLVKHNITALRRVRKTDNNRIARATGATIVNRVEDLRESDVGAQCGLFEIEKIGDEYFTFITKCKGPKACTILLRGPSKDILNEIERNLQDAMFVARNVVFRPRLSPGGGATEMAVSVRLAQLAKEVEGVQQWPYKAVAEAMEVIPRTLVQNSGSSPIRVLTKLRAKHAEGQHTWGIDGHNGNLVDMKQQQSRYDVPISMNRGNLLIEFQAACLLLRVDDICSAKSAKQSGGNMGEPED
ncbi:MAG: hypothetical protein Q9182_005575 [Xanthomendoza sp. 2 TL-2023]